MDGHEMMGAPTRAEHHHRGDNPRTEGGPSRAVTPEITRLRLDNERLRIELEQALQAMAAREVIEQAKGLLMGYYRCDDRQAFALLRDLSQHANVKLRSVAVTIVELARRDGRVHYPGLDTLAAVLLTTPDDGPDGPGPTARPSGWI